MTIKLKEILKVIGDFEFMGDQEKIVEAPIQATSQEIKSENILWVSDKNIHLLSQIKLGTVICSIRVNKVLLGKDCNYILVDNPRFTFQKILETFFSEKPEIFISERAIIHTSAKIGVRASIGHGVVIEENCSLGDDVFIDHNTIIKRNTVIGDRVKIGANCTIGGVGFGYEKDEEGQYKFIPHLGNVIIKSNAEIGNCTAIDRAVLGSTVVGENCKVDNLVHIAHGVNVGKNSLVIANAMVAGSVSIGENVWIAPSSSILNNRSIGNNATIGMGAVILKNVEPGQVMVGNPGKSLTIS